MKTTAALAVGYLIIVAGLVWGACYELPREEPDLHDAGHHINWGMVGCRP